MEHLFDASSIRRSFFSGFEDIASDAFPRHSSCLFEALKMSTVRLATFSGITVVVTVPKPAHPRQPIRETPSGTFQCVPLCDVPHGRYRGIAARLHLRPASGGRLCIHCARDAVLPQGTAGAHAEPGLRAISAEIRVMVIVGGNSAAANTMVEAASNPGKSAFLIPIRIFLTRTEVQSVRQPPLPQPVPAGETPLPWT